MGVHYRRDLSEGESSQEVVEIVGGSAARAEVVLPLVYAEATADRVAYHEGERELSRRLQVELEVAPRTIAAEVLPGQKIRIPAGVLGAEASDWMVRSVRGVADRRLALRAHSYRPGLYVYPPDRLVRSAEAIPESTGKH